MDVSITEHGKFMDMVSDSTMQPPFTTLQLVEFWCCIKEEYLKISEKAIKILLFPTA